MKVFLAFSFRPEDKELVGYIDRLLASHDVRIVTGERMGGEALTPSIKARIDGVDALVAVLTRRDKIEAGGWTTHQWVQDEMAYALARNKAAIAVVEDGVGVGGMFQPNERLVFSKDAFVDLLLDLSETIAVWRAGLGRTVKVQLLPSELARRVGMGHEGFRCRHRLVSQGRFTEWQEVVPVPEVGGTFVFVKGVNEDHLIQLEVSGTGSEKWLSLAASQWMQVELSSGRAS